MQMLLTRSAHRPVDRVLNVSCGSQMARPSSKVYKTTFKSRRPNVAMY